MWILVDFQARLCHTWRVGQAQIALGAAGFGGGNFDFSRARPSMVVESFLLGNRHSGLPQRSRIQHHRRSAATAVIWLTSSVLLNHAFNPREGPVDLLALDNQRRCNADHVIVSLFAQYAF